MRRRGSRLTLVTGMALAVMVAVTAGLALRWWSHPDVFGEQGGAGDFVADPRPVSRAQMTFAVVLPPVSSGTPTVTFRSAPVMTFATNSAQTRITFGICHPIRHAGAIGNVFGSGNPYCRRIDPIVAGTVFELGRNGAYIIATSTPTRPGRVVMTGADLNYSLDRDHWYRRGVDHVDFRNVQRVSVER